MNARIFPPPTATTAPPPLAIFGNANHRPMTRILLMVAIGSVVFVGCSADEGNAPRTASRPLPGSVADAPVGPEAPWLKEKIAGAYLAENFARIEWLTYTFNVARGDQTTKRQWEWHPKTETVRFRGHHANTDTDFTYDRHQIPHVGEAEGEMVRAIDRMFINDRYWLLFPLQLAWDDVKIHDDGEVPLPIGTGTARRATVRYPATGGYTPGDVYELFLDEKFFVVQWNFRRAGSDTDRPATWAAPHRVGPIALSLSHEGPTAAEFRLWFSDVTVTVTVEGEETVFEPRPLFE